MIVKSYSRGKHCKNAKLTKENITKLKFRKKYKDKKLVVILKIMEDKKTWAKDAMPLLLMAIWIALSIILFVIMEIISRTVELGVEGGPLQSISFSWIFISLIVFFALGIWAVIQGIILIKNKKNVKTSNARNLASFVGEGLSQNKI